ncbi:hypothetical protein D3C71_1360990 [compost metagenome]
MEYMYCGRFHAMILSMLYNQKLLPVVYSNKMTNVLEDIAYRGKYIHMGDMEDVEVSWALQQIESNEYDINQQIIDAQTQFSALDIFLNT